MEEKYEKIACLPHHVSRTRRRMEIKDRAAQFAPYAALVGFGDVVAEAARITEERAIQDEGEIERINRLLTYILTNEKRTKAEFTYFVKDERKSGGAYVKKTGYAVSVDEVKQRLIFSDKTFLSIGDIVQINLI